MTSEREAPREGTARKTPCGGRYCYLMGDGTWIHSPKSYHECSIKPGGAPPVGRCFHFWARGASGMAPAIVSHAWRTQPSGRIECRDCGISINDGAGQSCSAAPAPVATTGERCGLCYLPREIHPVRWHSQGGVLHECHGTGRTTRGGGR